MNVDDTLRKIKRFIPRSLFSFAQPFYHGGLAFLGALIYRFPAREMIVIGVTGTKGKSSVCEYLNAIFEEAGHTTALISTIRIKIADESNANKRRMTMPGRTFIQRNLRKAKAAGCTVAILEITSEGARQWRDRFLDLDALIFTNLSPEHIESHGSFENYAAAKLSIATRLLHSKKRPRIMVANIDDEYGKKFLRARVEKRIPFSLKDAEPYIAHPQGSSFRFADENVHINFPGEFSIKNALAASKLASEFGIEPDVIRTALEKLSVIPGRAEDVAEGLEFAVVVDYAHTADSLEALYKAYDGRRRICVLGSTGGGRDKWKRPKMGEMADRYCAHVILTNEDPYDEKPEKIVEDVASGMQRDPEIIMDRRSAIKRAIEMAAPGDAILITGKGTDPTICGPNGSQEPWSDSEVAREELEKLEK